ncbi:MAG: alpha-2-macroglobulin, partial [Thermoguttaceae bacterium]
VYMVLVDAGVKNADMREFLYRDRTKLAVYALAMYGIALEKEGEKDKLAMVLRNIGQYVQEDNENQTAWLNLPGGYWWYWYGSEYEAHAYYLKLLARTDPKGELASRLVKYLLNNRKHASYWNSTRDTAICIEAMAEYLRKSGEDRPEMTVEVFWDGKLQKAVEITPKTLFGFDNKFVLRGLAVTAGQHEVKLVKKGAGPLYYNGYLTTFTLEDPIARAGLEIKVQRRYYQLVKEDKTRQAAGSRGQVVDEKVEKYRRVELENLATLTTGDLVEIELEIDSKNDYEYVVFEDMKPAGFEPVDQRSGYTGNDLGAYVEYRDNRVVLFARTLARGKHSVAYRMRAETPGRFSALPTRAWAMYAPELKANSDEIKLQVKD